MWIKWLIEKIPESSKKIITINWVKYSILRTSVKTYIFDESFLVPAKWLLKTPNWEQVFDINETWKITQNWNFDVYSFSYYNFENEEWKILVYTEDWHTFKEVNESNIINKHILPSTNIIIEKQKWNFKEKVRKFLKRK